MAVPRFFSGGAGHGRRDGGGGPWGRPSGWGAKVRWAVWAAEPRDWEETTRPPDGWEYPRGADPEVGQDSKLFGGCHPPPPEPCDCGVFSEREEKVGMGSRRLKTVGFISG